MYSRYSTVYWNREELAITKGQKVNNCGHATPHIPLTKLSKLLEDLVCTLAPPQSYLPDIVDIGVVFGRSEEQPHSGHELGSIEGGVGQVEEHTQGH